RDYGLVSTWRMQRSLCSALVFAAWGLSAILLVSSLTPPLTFWLVPLLLLPFAVVAVAHSGPFARNRVPCRTVAWTLLWAVPAAMLAWRFAHGQPVLSWVIGWLLAAVVVGWRFAQAAQHSRVYGRQQGRIPSGTGPA